MHPVPLLLYALFCSFSQHIRHFPSSDVNCSETRGKGLRGVKTEDMEM